MSKGPTSRRKTSLRRASTNPTMRARAAISSLALRPLPVSEPRRRTSSGASNGSRSMASIIARHRVTACSRDDAADSSGVSLSPTQVPRPMAAINAIR